MKKVMFVCKKNSARSQMAEGFAKTLGKGQIEVTSSGLEASQVRPEAIATMKEIGIDTRCATKNDRIRVLDDNLMVLISESLANQDQKTSCTSRYSLLIMPYQLD